MHLVCPILQVPSVSQAREWFGFAYRWRAGFACADNYLSSKHVLFADRDITDSFSNVAFLTGFTSTSTIYIYQEKARPLKEAYVPDQRSVSRSLAGTNSSNTSLEGFKRGCRRHDRRQVVPLSDCSR